MARRQSPEDRIKRLKKGCCPIHGMFMGQISCWEKRVGGELDGELVTTVECERKACGIKAYAVDIDGPYELFPEFKHLLSRDPKHPAET